MSTYINMSEENKWCKSPQTAMCIVESISTQFVMLE